MSDDRYIVKSGVSAGGFLMAAGLLAGVISYGKDVVDWTMDRARGWRDNSRSVLPRRSQELRALEQRVRAAGKRGASREELLTLPQHYYEHWDPKHSKLPKYVGNTPVTSLFGVGTGAGEALAKWIAAPERANNRLITQLAKAYGGDLPPGGPGIIADYANPDYSQLQREHAQRNVLGHTAGRGLETALQTAVVAAPIVYAYNLYRRRKREKALGLGKTAGWFWSGPDAKLDGGGGVSDSANQHQAVALYSPLVLSLLLSSYGAKKFFDRQRKRDEDKQLESAKVRFNEALSKTSAFNRMLDDFCTNAANSINSCFSKKASSKLGPSSGGSMFSPDSIRGAYATYALLAMLGGGLYGYHHGSKADPNEAKEKDIKTVLTGLRMSGPARQKLVFADDDEETGVMYVRRSTGPGTSVIKLPRM